MEEAEAKRKAEAEAKRKAKEEAKVEAKKVEEARAKVRKAQERAQVAQAPPVRCEFGSFLNRSMPESGADLSRRAALGFLWVLLRLFVQSLLWNKR